MLRLGRSFQRFDKVISSEFKITIAPIITMIISVMKAIKDPNQKVQEKVCKHLKKKTSIKVAPNRQNKKKLFSQTTSQNLPFDAHT